MSDLILFLLAIILAGPALLSLFAFASLVWGWFQLRHEAKAEMARLGKEAAQRKFEEGRAK